MPGPISTNAPFTEFGNSMILRDIEQLYLLVGQISGDLGKQNIKATDTAANTANTSGIPAGYSVVTISICVGGLVKSLDVIAKGPY